MSPESDETVAYQLSTQDGNSVQRADSHSDAMRAAQSLADRTHQTVLVSERGADEDDFATVEPSGTSFRIERLDGNGFWYPLQQSTIATVVEMRDWPVFASRSAADAHVRDLVAAGWESRRLRVAPR